MIRDKMVSDATPATSTSVPAISGYWTLRHDQAMAQFGKAQNSELAGVYLKLAVHYRSLATLTETGHRKPFVTPPAAASTTDWRVAG